MAFLVPVGLVFLFVAASFPVGLAAMTSALLRRGLDVPAINKVSRANIVTGLLMFVPALFAWPMALPAACLLLIGAVTAAANRPATHRVE
jgi:hypothetical protein